MKEVKSFGYIFVADSFGLDSDTLATTLAEVTQNNDHYTVEGHSRSLHSVPIEIQLCDSL